MLELIWKPDTGREVAFIAPSTPMHPDYLLIAVDGLHGLAANVHDYVQYQQHGTTYVGSQLRPRTITIRGRVYGDVDRKRIDLLEAMDPAVEGTLVLRRGEFVRKIRCVVEQAPSFAQQNGWMFTLRLMAPDPYWRDDDGEVRIDVASWEPVFEWELDIPTDEGIIFGTRTQSSVINIYNSSDAEIGMRVTFTALGRVSRPALIQVVDDRRYIKADMDMEPGDKIEINTDTRNLYARLVRGGMVSNIFGQMDPDSELAMQLQRGDNLFRFEAEDGELMLDAVVFYELRYLGV